MTKKTKTVGGKYSGKEVTIGGVKFRLRGLRYANRNEILGYYLEPVYEVKRGKDEH